MTPRLRIGWLEGALLTLGLFLLAAWSTSYFEARDFQLAESGKLEAALRWAGPISPETAAGAVVFRGLPPQVQTDRVPQEAEPGRSVLGRLEIPRLHIAAMVAEGTGAKTLRHAVGHIPSTPLPGRPGNCSLAGHRDTFLRGLGGVRVDDVVRVVTLDRTYTYRVEWAMVVDPYRVDVLDSTATRSLTLVTCYPFVFVGRAPQRFVVRARQVETIPPRALLPTRVAPAAGAIRPAG